MSEEDGHEIDLKKIQKAITEQIENVSSEQVLGMVDFLLRRTAKYVYDPAPESCPGSLAALTSSTLRLVKVARILSKKEKK